jgi:hypothetical protein
MRDDEPVEIADVSVIESELVRTFLVDEGITAHLVPSAQAGVMDFGLNRVRIFVPAAQAERARAAMAVYDAAR